MTSAIVIAAVFAVACIGYVDADYAISCDDMKDHICHSGYFEVQTGAENLISVYCSADNICESKGWTRAGMVNYSNPQQPCPAGMEPHDEPAFLRTCKIQVGAAGSNSINVPTQGMSYRKVCGKVRAYQYASPDAFDPAHTGAKDIELAYMDGISVTHGASGSRTHIFSLVASIRAGAQCPCAPGATNEDGSSIIVPSFIGNNLYCESGSTASGWSKTLYKDDVLWDGLICHWY